MTVPQRLCFSAQLSNCNLSSCWHIEFSILSLPHLSISIHLRIRFGCSMKFFQLRITLGLALGESWPLLAQPQKNTDVYKGLLAGKAFLSKPVVTEQVSSRGSLSQMPWKGQPKGSMLLSCHRGSPEWL